MAQSSIETAVTTHPGVSAASTRLREFRAQNPHFETLERQAAWLRSTLAAANAMARAAAHTGHTDPSCLGCQVLALNGYRPMQTLPAALAAESSAA